MSRLTRRSFVSWIGAVTAALGVSKRAAARGLEEPLVASLPLQPAGLPAAELLALSQAVLPSELGTDGMARAARNFSKWANGYRTGAEILHGYGTDKVITAGESPVGAWGRQLIALNQLAREQHKAAFTSLSVSQRQDVVRAALAGEKIGGMPSPLEASHVAVGLLSWFYSSPDATDLCYEAKIGKNQCRPLVNSSREPLAIKSREEAGTSGRTDGSTPRHSEDPDARRHGASL